MPSGSDIRVPSRALSAAEQGRVERPGAAGSPVGAEEVHSLPTHRAQKTTETEEPPHEVIVWELFIVHSACRDGNLLRKAVSSVATSGCPKRSEGGCPCRSKDEHRRPHNR